MAFFIFDFLFDLLCSLSTSFRFLASAAPVEKQFRPLSPELCVTGQMEPAGFIQHKRAMLCFEQFAIMNTAYILVGLQLEERDLIAEFGATYQQYRRHVPMLLPRVFGRRREGAPL